jgi:hypothetical protein
MKKAVLVLGLLVVIVIVVRLLTGEGRERMKQHCAQMMEQMPDW